MIKPSSLKKGDKVAIVSLSRGLLGESFIKHELDLGIQRLKELGLDPVIMPNSLKGMDYLEAHPEARASDLKMAFSDQTIKGIICAIGGDDTYKLIPYLLEDEEFIRSVRENPKIFTGFSDSTINHLMLYKIGLVTFYGPCFLVDLAELDKEMLPYTKEYFLKFFENEKEFPVLSSSVWYEDRKSYDPSQLNIPRISHEEEHGYEVLNGTGIATGTLYGGCIESLYDAISSTGTDEAEICNKYHLVLTKEELKGKILFLESSDLKTPPHQLEKMIIELKNYGLFDYISGLIVGKPIDEVYYDEYKDIYKRLFKDIDLPIIYNVNFGHSVPRCIIPYGILAELNCDDKMIKIIENIFEG